ncbi:hypothetical protein H9P43_007696 [Blastocladiella emersonii ATCC 22665]|nr:hypothetical protein H9P43_007696 [Blastocladiella emersonii ATCC 22665]
MESHEPLTLPYLGDELWTAVARYLDYADLTVFAAACRRHFTLVYSTPAFWLGVWTTHRLPPPPPTSSPTPTSPTDSPTTTSPARRAPIAAAENVKLCSLDLTWMHACPRHAAVLARRLHAESVRPLVRAVWLPFILSGTVDLVGVLQLFPNLSAVSGDTSVLTESFSTAVLRLREARPAASPAATYPLPNLQRCYLNDEPSLAQYTLLVSVVPFLTPHPNPLSVTLCLQCRAAVHPHTADHDEFGCPVTGCLGCVPASECMRCGHSFCAAHLTPVASLCPRALVDGIQDAVCTWCTAQIARCETCGVLDCPHCREVDPPAAPAPGSPVPGAPAPAVGTAASAPVATCARCRATQCSGCCRTYYCGRCGTALCASCVDGCVCVACDSTLATCAACYIDVHLARDDMYASLPKKG